MSEKRYRLLGVAQDLGMVPEPKTRAHERGANVLKKNNPAQYWNTGRARDPNNHEKALLKIIPHLGPECKRQP